MIVDWYCQKCGEKLPLGLWDKIPVVYSDPYENPNGKRSLQCPKCEHNYFYCIMEGGK